MARGVKAKKDVKQGLGVLQNNFYARATNLSKKRTFSMISDFSQQILTLLEGAYFHATRLKLPEQLITTRAIRTLQSKDGQSSTNSKISCTASHLRHPLHLPITTTKRLLTLRRLMSYIHGAPILDVSRSHTTTQHGR